MINIENSEWERKLYNLLLIRYRLLGSPAIGNDVIVNYKQTANKSISSKFNAKQRRFMRPPKLFSPLESLPISPKKTSYSIPPLTKPHSIDHIILFATHFPSSQDDKLYLFSCVYNMLHDYILRINANQDKIVQFSMICNDIFTVFGLFNDNMATLPQISKIATNMLAIHNFNISRYLKSVYLPNVITRIFGKDKGALKPIVGSMIEAFKKYSISICNGTKITILIMNIILKVYQ